MGELLADLQEKQSATTSYFQCLSLRITTEDIHFRLLLGSKSVDDNDDGYDLGKRTILYL